MPKREPKFSGYPDDLSLSKERVIAVGAVHPSEPVQGSVTGQNQFGYDEAVLVTPGGLTPDEVEILKFSSVADCALKLRDNLLNRPNRLSRAGGPLEAKETTWVLCKRDGWFFRPIAAQVGDEQVDAGLLSQIWENING